MLSKRLSTMLLSGAAVAGLGATANASLTIYMQAFQKNFVNLSGTDTAQSVHVVPGDVVSCYVVADVISDSPIAGKFQCIQSAAGSVISTGGLKGSYADAGGLPQNFLESVFSGNSSSAGFATDLDGDGDLDLGSTNDADASNFVAFRSNALAGPNLTQGTGTVGGTPNAYDHNPVAIAGGTRYFLSNELDFTVAAGASGTTNLLWKLRNASTAYTWFENADQLTANGGGGKTKVSYANGTQGTAVFAGPAVVLSAGGGVVPEPASLGLLSLVGLGALARRRK